MTVCLAIKVYDGIVFAADSAASLTIQGVPGVSNVFNHADKVFNLHKKLPVVAMTCGMGHIGDASIATLAKELRILLMRGDENYVVDANEYTIEEIATKSFNFLCEKYAETKESLPDQHAFQFSIGGYGSNGCSGEIWRIQFLNGVETLEHVVKSDQGSGMSWSGQPEAINRLILGYDPVIMKVLQDAGVDAETLKTISEKIRAATEVPVVHAPMPIIDAIQLAEFLVDVTKRFFAFKPGADIVGGETDIATVTRHEGFKWIRRKHYYTPELNPRETDHA